MRLFTFAFLLSVFSVFGAGAALACGGDCEIICADGCDNGHHYEWRSARCHKASYSDSVGAYCDDGYHCDFGPCGRAHERVCNTAFTGCDSCQPGYTYESDRVFCGVKSANPGNHPNWMTTHYASLAWRPLNHVAIPGTHNSGTYLMRGFSRCQRKNIEEQLEGGIRYFDLRVGILDGTGQVVRHGIDYVGPTLDVVLDDVAAFVRTRKELVILKFSHFDHATVWKDYTQADWNELSVKIDTKLGPYLIDHATLRPHARFDAVLPPNRTTGRVVILMGGHPRKGATRELKNGKPRYWYDSYQGSYANSDNRATVKKKLQDTVAAWDRNEVCTSAGKCWVGGYCTDCPAGKDPWTYMHIFQLEAAPSSTYPEWLSRDTNPVTLRWIRDLWNPATYGVVQVDYYDSSCLVPMMIWLNTDPDGVTRIPNCYTYPGGDTRNGQTQADKWDAKVWPY